MTNLQAWLAANTVSAPPAPSLDKVAETMLSADAEHAAAYLAHCDRLSAPPADGGFHLPETGASA